jgi:peptidoglycan/LPS O-acetylase OafA/YrhL
MITQNRRLIAIVLTVVFLLLIPFTAMQFTDEVDWKLFDFVLMGILLLGTGLLCEFIVRKVKNMDYRIGIIAVILVVLILIWAELAVGIFGSPFAGS